MFNGHRPIRIADVTSADPQAVFLRALLNGNAAVLLKDVRAWMWVPLAVKGRIIGGLGVAHARRNYFTAHHAALALSMADQVAITMVNAELYEHAQALAALQERQRLAQNLHDAVNQSLFSAGLIAEVLPRLWERDQAEARQSLEDLRRLTRGALAEMRELAGRTAAIRPDRQQPGRPAAPVGQRLHRADECPGQRENRRGTCAPRRNPGGALPDLPGSAQ